MTSLLCFNTFRHYQGQLRAKRLEYAKVKLQEDLLDILIAGRLSRDDARLITRKIIFYDWCILYNKCLGTNQEIEYPYYVDNPFLNTDC